MYKKQTELFLICTLAVFSSIAAKSQVVISEFMAINDTVIADEDMDFSDWIELKNTSSNSVDLTGWYLTDDAGELTKWQFPATNMPPDSFLLIFASDKDRAVAGDQLHTNFKLSGDGEYLGLVKPDGITVESEYAPTFPSQIADLSYGITGDRIDVTLVNDASACAAFVPSDDSMGAQWRESGFDDSSWTGGTPGVGYDTGSSYGPLIDIDMQSQMYGGNSSVYIRIPFDLSETTELISLTLRMKYDDGFIAYLNGVEVASANAPATPVWNSTATDGHLDGDALVFADYNVTAFKDVLTGGENILAIHGLNRSLTSSDMLIFPQLECAIASEATGDEIGFLDEPSPGTANFELGVAGFVKDTRFSIDRGFYTTNFTVEITTYTPDATIIYTTDSSTPSLTNGTQSIGSLASVNITNTTVLRAAAFKTGLDPSNVDTHTYLFLSDVVAQSDDVNDYEYTNWNNLRNDRTADYGMDTDDVVGVIATEQEVADALLALPTISIATDSEKLFDQQTGIYSNSREEGIEWERDVSMELFGFSHGQQTQIRCGLRMAGNASRSDNRFKHNMRVAFRSEYGDNKLTFPLFPDSEVTKFNSIQLRGGNGDSWIHPDGAVRGRACYNRDQWHRDAHRVMGGKSQVQLYAHLYINGMYWGVFHIFERIEADYLVEHEGGDEEDWDVRDHIGAFDGTEDEWLACYAIADDPATMADPANYAAIQQHLDLKRFADWLLVHFYSNSDDWDQNNIRMARNRAYPDTWKFYTWDQERALLNTLSTPNVYGNIAINKNTNTSTRKGPTHVHQKLRVNPEYRLLFADRVRKHCFNGGALTPTVAGTIWDARAAELRPAIIAESARWGDLHAALPYTPAIWETQITVEKTGWFDIRTPILIGLLQNANLYPLTAAPDFTINGTPQHGGSTPLDALLGITAPSGTIYYTLDGSDPRATDGTVQGAEYLTPVSLTHPAIVKARVLDGGEWSALTEAHFLVGTAADSNLAITEVHYNPAPLPAPSEYGNDDFEFIEIHNTGDETLYLAGYELNGGIEFSFDDSHIGALPPDGYVVIVRNLDAFSARYNTNGMILAGEYSGKLSNSGEEIRLEFYNNKIYEISYNNARGWPCAADGGGPSLIPDYSAVSEQGFDILDYPGNWRASTYIGGSPGEADPQKPEGLVINELVAHTDTGLDPPYDSNDQIELYNPTDSAITLDGFWYLSDTLDEPLKWNIPAGTVIPSKGWVFFDEDDFHPERVAGFGLDKAGELVILSHHPPAEAARVVDCVSFKGQPNGTSLGRYPDDNPYLQALIPTPGTANQLPPPGIRIQELMYNPSEVEGIDSDEVLEYIMLTNASLSTINFDGGAGCTNTWRFNGGIDYSFKPGTSMIAGEKLWLVPFDPESEPENKTLFCSTYSLDAQNARLLGPYSGDLSDSGERIALEKPQASDDLLAPEDISWIIVDEVTWLDEFPWPAGADGTGLALLRTGTAGNDPLCWSLSEYSGPKHLISYEKLSPGVITWDGFNTIPNHSGTDYADTNSFNEVSVSITSGTLYSFCDGPVKLIDGAGQNGSYNHFDSIVFMNGVAGRIQVDLKRIIPVNSINTYSWYTDYRQNQHYDLYYSIANTAPEAGASTINPADSGWILLDTINSSFDASTTGQIGVNIRSRFDETIMYARHLLWDLKDNSTCFSEFDVFMNGSFVTNDVPGAWLNSYGLAATDTMAMTDSDSDGLLNWKEFYAGTDPTDAGSLLKITSAGRTSTQQTIRWRAVAGRTYTIQFKSLLADEDWTTLETGIPGVEPECEKTLELNGDSGFIRVLAE